MNAIISVCIQIVMHTIVMWCRVPVPRVLGTIVGTQVPGTLYAYLPGTPGTWVDGIQVSTNCNGNPLLVPGYGYRVPVPGYCVPGYRYPGTGMHMAGKGGKIWRANLYVPICSYGVVSNRTTYVYDIRYDASYENFG